MIDFSSNEICIFDIEASGLSDKSYPIEIAFTTLLGEDDSFLINPQTAKNWSHWCIEAAQVHKIPRHECINKGISVFDAVNRLNSQLAMCLILSDAPDQDLFWLTRLFDEVDTEMRFTVMGIGEFASRFSATPDAFATFTSLKAKTAVAHRALADSKQILELANNADLFVLK